MGQCGGRLVWGIIAAIVLADTVVMATFGLRFDWAGAALPAGACAVLLGGATLYRTARPEPRLAAALDNTAQLVAFSAAAAVLSYATTPLDRPLWNDTFAAWDAALGFDWPAYLAIVGAHPWLCRLYNVAYASLMPQYVVLGLTTGLTGRIAAGRQFILAVALAGTATILVAALMPSVTVYAHRGLPAAAAPLLDVGAGFAPMGPYLGLRDGTLRVISLTGADGIITFPSFHAVLAVLFAATAWRVPALRWPGLALNALMLVATPVNGGHYGVDVLAGIGIAVAAVAAARRLVRDVPEHRPAPLAEPAAVPRPVPAPAPA